MTPFSSPPVIPPFDPTEDSRARFTADLMFDTFTLLERHGYVLPTEQQSRRRAHADALVALRRLVLAFEGREV